jgi:predicted kinase
MKTTLDIPEKELKDAMRYTGAKTKRAAVVEAVTDFNRRQRLKALAEKLGTFEGFQSPEELLDKRNSEIVR